MAPYLIWFLIGFAFIILEMFLPGFIVVFFGLGAWVVSGILFFIMAISTEWQVGLFIIFSLLFLVLLRRFALKTFTGLSGKKEDDGFMANETGVQVEVTKDIAPGKPGEIKFRGSFWQAVAIEFIEQGEMAQILGKADDSGLIYNVKPLSK